MLLLRGKKSRTGGPRSTLCLEEKNTVYMKIRVARELKKHFFAILNWTFL